MVLYSPAWINICRYSFGFRQAESLQRHDREPEGMGSAPASVSFAVIQMVFKAMPHNSWLVFAFSCDWQVHTSTVNFNLNDRRLNLHRMWHHQKFLTGGGRLQTSKGPSSFFNPLKKKNCVNALFWASEEACPQCQQQCDSISVENSVE